MLLHSLGVLLLAATRLLPSNATAPACNLSGLWNFAPIDASSGWSGSPFTYNITHHANGTVSFPGFTTLASVDLTWRPSDAFSRAVGALRGRVLTLTLQDVGHKPGATANVSATVHASCDFIDMEGARYDCSVPTPAALTVPLVGGMFSRGGSPIEMAPSQWMRTVNAWLLRAATICSTDGRNVSLLTPGFPLGYVGQWMRDSFYGISSGIDLLPNITATVASVEWMYEHARPVDGAMPQSVDPAGQNDSFYEWGQRCNQTVGAPLWRSCIDLDSGPFAVKMADAIVSALPEHDGKAFFLKWHAALANGLNVTTLDPDGSGLPWINSSRQLIGYGFQDGEYMSGDVLYSSILYWNATGILADLYAQAGPSFASQVTALRAQAERVKHQISAELWSDKLGAFVAATQLESDRISVWGNAFAGVSGLANATQSAAIFAFFRDREADIFFEGQVRQTPAPHFWDSTHTGHNTYQDGAYWGTPLDHVLTFIGQTDRAMACRLLHDSIASYRSHGINEWIGPFYPASTSGARGYVASAAGSYGASKALHCHD